MVRKVELVPSPEMALTAATLELLMQDGSTRQAHTPLALGNPGRPMSWDDMRVKFVSLTEPVLGAAAATSLFAQVRRLDERAWTDLNDPLTANRAA
jgi:2-methylcitrate dehydratase PrpD